MKITTLSYIISFLPFLLFDPSLSAFTLTNKTDFNPIVCEFIFSGVEEVKLNVDRGTPWSLPLNPYEACEPNQCVILCHKTTSELVQYSLPLTNENKNASFEATSTSSGGILINEELS